MKRKILYLIYRLFARFTPNSYRPYALFFSLVKEMPCAIIFKEMRAWCEYRVRMRFFNGY